MGKTLRPTVSVDVGIQQIPYIKYVIRPHSICGVQRVKKPICQEQAHSWYGDWVYVLQQ